MKKINMKPDCVFSPQPLYLIGTKNEDGSANFCIISWLGFSFDQTPHIVMTVAGSKLTKTNLLRERKFSANLISEDHLWLADYFGNSKGEEKKKDEVFYRYSWGNQIDVPIIEQSHWAYECEVKQVWELQGAHLFLSEIKNIQIDEQWKDMDMQSIDLRKVKPVIYGPNNYFAIGEKLGNENEWKQHFDKLD